MCLSGCRRCNCRLRGKRCSGSTDARQINLECRSLAGLAVNPNEAFALLNNSVDGREAKASAFRSLRCKEGLEDMSLCLGVHASTGIADGEHHVFTGFKWGMQAGVAFVEDNICSLDGEFAAVGHGIELIHGQVNDYLLALAWVGLY